MLRGVVSICPWELLLLPGLCFMCDFVAWGRGGGDPPVFGDLLIHDSFTTSAG